MKKKEPLSPELRDFFKAILSLQTEQECESFFEDIATIKEQRDLAQRLYVARLLDEGEKYKRIEELTGASTATISRVKRCLDYGSGGYETVLARIAGTDDDNEKGEQQ